MGNFILGAPIETKEHLENTIKFSRKLPLDFAYFSPLVYLKGSELWTQAFDEGKIRAEESFAKSDSARGLGNFTKEELDEWCIKAFKGFYLNPKYVVSQFFQQLFVRRNFRLFKAGLKVFLDEEDNILKH